MSLFPRPRLCGFLAMVYRKSCINLLKVKIRMPKLDSEYYARIYDRFQRAKGARRREATMPLEYQPKIEKIVELLLHLAHKRPDADKYQAVKFFYLADREHLIRYGRPISFEVYYAMSFGPVASTVLEFLNGDLSKAEKVGIDTLPFKIEIGKAKNGSDTTYIRSPLREVNYDLFSKTDIKVFDEILAKYRDASFDDLFKATHEHFAWKNAWTKRRLGERAEMFYEEMIEDEKRRARLVEDFSSVASHM
jgi:uncharacterized phage-associated protein